MFKEKKGITLFGLLITLVFSLLVFVRVPFIDTLEEKLYDLRFRLRGSVSHQNKIIIAAIDENSIERIGRWPWGRDVMAKLIEKLSQAGAELIVFDVIFSEREKNDYLFAKEVRKAGNIIFPLVLQFEKRRNISKEKIERFAIKFVENEGQSKPFLPISAEGILAPVPELLSEAMSVGLINMFPDDDGTLRWETLYMAFDGLILPSLSLEVASIYLGVPKERIIIRAGEGIQIGKRFLKTDRWGRIPIYYYGTNGTFKYISISDVIDGKIPASEIEGKIVLIGATAAGIYDLRVTPFSPAMPGVEKHANVISSIIENRQILVAPKIFNLLFVLISGFTFVLIIRKLKAFLASIVVSAFLFVILFMSFFLFVKKGLWLDTVHPSMNVLFIFVSTITYSYAREEKRAKEIKRLFSSYVTERVVEELIKHPEMARLGGERREVTVLFSDIRGFTSLSEKYPPEEVVNLLNEYLSEMTEVVFKWEGTLDKFMGDAIMAFWGAPLRQENHAELAVKCALHMVSKLLELQKKWMEEQRPILDFGIGINTGDVLVGNIGAEGKKMDYTVIGDHVNLASRVEGLTRKFDTRILITEFTLEKIRPLIEEEKIWRVFIRELERVTVKGKEKPVQIYEIKSLEGSL